MGDNDFISVEHTGVRVRQMAGTLERVVKYDAVAFQKAWDFLASSDDEDNYFFFFFFFVELFSPEREQNMAFFGATVFFAAIGPCRVMSLEKKKFQIKKRQRFAKKSSPRASDTGKGSSKHNAPDLWDREEVDVDVILGNCTMTFVIRI